MDPARARYFLRLLFSSGFVLCVVGYVAVCLYLSTTSKDPTLVALFLSQPITVITLFAAFLKYISSIKDGKPESDMLGTPTINNTPNASPLHFPNYQATQNTLQVSTE